MKKYGPPGASANGHNENRALFATGKCAMWIDATSAAGYIFNPKESQVADKTAFAPAPTRQVTPRRRAGLGLGARRSGILHQGRCRQEFVEWATSKDYVEAGGRGRGLGRGSSRNPQIHLRQARLSGGRALRQDGADRRSQSADPTKPTEDPVPYTGVQFVGDPRVPGHRHVGRPGDRRGTGRPEDGRRGARRRPGGDSADDDRRQATSSKLDPPRRAASPRRRSLASGRERCAMAEHREPSLRRSCRKSASDQSRVSTLPLVARPSSCCSSG